MVQTARELQVLGEVKRPELQLDGPQVAPVVTPQVPSIPAVLAAKQDRHVPEQLESQQTPSEQ